MWQVEAWVALLVLLVLVGVSKSADTPPLIEPLHHLLDVTHDIGVVLTS